LVSSIGVIYLRSVLEQLLTEVSVEFSAYKRGEFKDMTGLWRTPTDHESEKFPELYDEIFNNFVMVVAARHGTSVRLVDKIDDFKDALETVALLGNYKPSPKWFRPSRSFPPTSAQ